MDTLTGARDPQRMAMRVIAGLVVFRLLYLIPFVAQFDLAGDESYYWDWGRQLDWGYYSKPPMIGWLMGLAGRLSGNSEWGIRIGALTLGAASLVLLYFFAKKLFGPRPALIAVLLAAFTPANAALNLLLTIDAPLVLCWTAALLVFWSLTENPANTSRWILLTIILGLGHLSKQMMLVFPLLMILHCALNPTVRTLLRRPAFWICLSVSLLFLAPVVWWNAQHDWVTLKHTSHHFATKKTAGLFDHLGTFGEFLGVQALAFTPITWVLMISAVFGGIWKWRALDVKERYLVIFSGPGLMIFALLSFRQNVNPNWPAVFYLGASVLAAAWLDRVALHVHPWTRMRGWLRPALLLSIILSAMMYLLPFAIGWAGLAGNDKFDPLLRLRGWKEVGIQAGGFLEKVPQPKNTFVLVLAHRDHASQLAFNMPQQPRVYRYVYRDVLESQYEIWPGPEDFTGSHSDALLFIPVDRRGPAEPEIPVSLTRQFDSIDALGEIRGPIGDHAERIYKVHLLRHLNFWAPPLRPDPAAEPENADAN
ncbi:MAG: glycosyltransferase family 39 protein [Verrucomicrobia bacterium]|nr:glycosyltransferase family 39 protein [Verrucomicrobiota bacterium]